jgi:hypothetical protein
LGYTLLAGQVMALLLALAYLPWWVWVLLGLAVVFALISEALS